MKRIQKKSRAMPAKLAKKSTPKGAKPKASSKSAAKASTKSKAKVSIKAAKKPVSASKMPAKTKKKVLSTARKTPAKSKTGVSAKFTKTQAPAKSKTAAKSAARALAKVKNVVPIKAKVEIAKPADMPLLSPAPVQKLAKPAAVRVAAGMRKPKSETGAFTEVMTHRHSGTAPLESAHSSEHMPPAARAPVPMSAAAKNRAAAEANFSLYVAPKAPSQPAAADARQSGDFEMRRTNERDSLTTALRLAQSKPEATRAAEALAERFRLPPDQGLLVRVLELGKPNLSKLALEELLELDDRGRVRPTPDLVQAVTAIRSRDPETRELKELLLEKVRAFTQRVPIM